ncbi:DUF2842 domain-containing protein [Asticcacaulis sp. AC402]|uniref:DUF2842 domain-containing protein n=1 Tax=Asticcacaulis sp. AC402 TaxID=1282361 RepID=UPI0003C3E25E|nr:DUF2842 domain-containing protein [Asticcacaulis sp. AC402]ESQ75389.1 membrane protein [Asticcacaulis sp. AC402]
MSDDQKPRLTLPQRRAITCGAIIIFLFVYVWLVASLGQLIRGGPMTALVFYALAGTLWGVPLIPLIAWSENYKRNNKK